MIPQKPVLSFNSILELFYGKLKFVQIATERVWKSPFRASLFITEIYRRQNIKGPQHNLRSIFYVLYFLPKMVYLAFWIIDRNLNERRKLQARHRGKISFFCKQARIVYK